MSQLANTSRYLIDIAIYRDYSDISRYINISIKTKSIRYRNRIQINIVIFDNIVISPKLTWYIYSPKPVNYFYIKHQVEQKFSSSKGHFYDETVNFCLKTLQRAQQQKHRAPQQSLWLPWVVGRGLKHAINICHIIWQSLPLMCSPSLVLFPPLLHLNLTEEVNMVVLMLLSLSFCLWFLIGFSHKKKNDCTNPRGYTAGSLVYYLIYSLQWGFFPANSLERRLVCLVWHEALQQGVLVDHSC